MLDCLRTFMKRVVECGGKYVDELRAFLEDSFDGVLNLGGLRVIAVVCEYVVGDTAHDLIRTKRELWDGR